MGESLSELIFSFFPIFLIWNNFTYFCFTYGFQLLHTFVYLNIAYFENFEIQDLNISFDRMSYLLWQDLFWVSMKHVQIRKNTFLCRE